MKKALFLLVVVMAAGCGESQLDRRAELETEENAGDMGDDGNVLFVGIGWC